MGSTLRISVDCDGGETCLLCAGEIDASNVSELSEAIGWSMTCDLRRLRIDLTEVGFIDSSVIQALLAAAQECERRDISFHVNESAEVTRLVDLVGLGDVIRSAHFGARALEVELHAADPPTDAPAAPNSKPAGPV